jgi:hypothetical protein
MSLGVCCALWRSLRQLDPLLMWLCVVRTCRGVLRSVAFPPLHGGAAQRPVLQCPFFPNSHLFLFCDPTLTAALCSLLARPLPLRRSIGVRDGAARQAEQVRAHAAG